MSNLAGQFAGIIAVAVEGAQRDELAAAIEALPGLHVHSVHGSHDVDGDLPLATIEAVGVTDRFGQSPATSSRWTEPLFALTSQSAPDPATRRISPCSRPPGRVAAGWKL